ncbi:MAG: peptide ABC transporter substrate-binding protein [Spirochaetaceae bacterium]
MNKLIIICILSLLSIFSLTSQSNEFNIAVSSLELTLNPFYTYTAIEAQYLSGIYEGLVSYSPSDLSPTSALAESWTLSEDKKTYTFILKDNIKFSNGDKITSKIYRNSLLKSLSPTTQAEFASLLDLIENAREYRTGLITDVEKVGIKTDGDKKLIFTLKKRAPYFTKILCHHSFTPIHPSLLESKSWSIEETITTGPYNISKNRDSIILTKNREYWDYENVYFDRINLKLYNESEKATSDYNAGKIDWLTEGAINLNKIADIETLKVNPLFATTYYYFNPNYKEYKDPKIRKAISLLIPWNKIREKQYIPANSLIPNLSNFPKNFTKDEQNIEEALKILEESGYKDGKGISDLIISIPQNTYNDKNISELVKEHVEKNSLIKVIINETPYPDFFTINRTEVFTLSTLSWIGDFADPLTFLEMWTSNSKLNDSNYSNMEYDNLVENSSNLTQDKRYIELSKAEAILLNDTIVLPISHSPGINVIDTRYIENWHPNILDLHPYKYLKVSNKHVIPGLI